MEERKGSFFESDKIAKGVLGQASEKEVGDERNMWYKGIVKVSNVIGETVTLEVTVKMPFEEEPNIDDVRKALHEKASKCFKVPAEFFIEKVIIYEQISVWKEVK